MKRFCTYCGERVYSDIEINTGECDDCFYGDWDDWDDLDY